MLRAGASAVREDVLVLIRGGGDDAEFAVFDAAPVIEALGACRAYRILGLGHSRNRTLADCVADWAASVPAEAGRHLAARVQEARGRPHPSPLAGVPLHRRLTLLWLAILLGAVGALLHLLARFLA
jgi:hypothetical protein